MKPLKITITFKLIIFSVILFMVMNFFQYIFVDSTLMKIIQTEKEAQFNERVDVVFQTLEQEEKRLQEALDSLQNQNESGRLSSRVMMEELLPGGSVQNLERQLRPEYQQAAVRALETIYYEKSKDKISPFIINRSGITVMDRVLGPDSGALASKEYIKRILKEQNGDFDYQSDGIDRWIVFRTFPEWGWTVCYSLTLEEKFATVSDFKYIYTGILLAVQLIFVVAVYFFMRKFLSPLKNVEAKITEISTGEGDLTRTVEVQSRDEVGDLAGSFNSFIKQLRGIVENIKSTAGQSLKIRDELGANTEETASALVEISTNVSNMRNHINKLDDNINSTVNSINQIDGNIHGLNLQMQEQSAMVREASASVTQMISSIDNVSKITKIKSHSSEKLLKTSADGGEMLKNTSDIFHSEIGDNVDKIGQMVSLISSIASKTNLLSMNAAIEAAHAGRSGLGFAVVADEIRKLAEESSRQVKDIKVSIKGIIGGIEDTEKSIEKTGTAFDLINREIQEVVQALSEIFASTEELSIGGKQILEAMMTLNDITVKISTSAEEMQQESVYVNKAMSDVKQISNEVTNGMTEVVRGTDEVNQAMSEISGLSVQLGSSNEKLEKEIDRFKTS